MILENELKHLSAANLLRDYIPYIEVMSDKKTIISKNGTLIRTLKILGGDGTDVSSEQILGSLRIVDNFLMLLPQNVRVNIYTLKRRLSEVEEEVLPIDEKKYKHASEITKIYNSQFQNNFISEIYLTISINFPDIFRNKKERDINEFQIALNAMRKELDSQVSQARMLLDKFAPVDVVNGSGNELFKFYSHLINSHDFNNRDSKNLFSNLALSDLEFNYHSGLVKINNDRCVKFSKTIAVKISVNESDYIFKDLLALNREFTIIQIIKSFSKQQNLKTFTNSQKELAQLSAFAPIEIRINDLKTAKEELEAGITNYLDLSCYIKVVADSEDELNDSILEIQGLLGQEGISSHVETLQAKSIYFAILPDMEGRIEHLRTSVRARLKAQNISEFINLSKTKEGYRRCPFGEAPVADFKTIDNGVYSFTFHQDDISDDCTGHTIVIGSNGTGKTTLISFLLMNCLKYENLKILAFDSKEGLRVPMTAFGGNYIKVGDDSGLQLNPFSLPDSFANRIFLENWLGNLAGGIHDGEKDIIDEVIRLNYEELLPEERSLANLSVGFGLPELDENQKGNISSRLQRWINTDTNTPYSKFFNNEKDTLNFDSRIACFEMGDVLNNITLLSPVSEYIFHKFNQVIFNNPSPHVVFIDEFSKYLTSTTFMSSVIPVLKEHRKLRGILVAAMQEASMLVDHPLGDQIIANIATLIIFPNTNARRQDYVDKLSLTDIEFDFVKNCTNPRLVLVKKKDGHSVIINVDLSILGNHLSLFSSKDTKRAKMKELFKSDPQNWVEKYLEASA